MPPGHALRSGQLLIRISKNISAIQIHDTSLTAILFILLLLMSQNIRKNECKDENPAQGQVVSIGQYFIKNSPYSAQGLGILDIICIAGLTLSQTKIE